MAKRKRLIPSSFGPDTVSDMAQTGPATAPDTKAHLQPGLGSSNAPPIARVAGDASAQAALSEMSDEWIRARREGRLVQALPLDAIEIDHLVRDRIVMDEEELANLMASIAEHGQRTPIEVTEITPGRFGLISGWRRYKALSRLFGQENDAKFSTVQALLRQPDTASDAYIAMVEENEIRQGLSYYERARIAARAADVGVFTSERQALQRLFAAASRPRRSKIGSFIAIYRQLDSGLRFPAAIPERLGLALAKALEEKADRVAGLLSDLKCNPQTTVASEQAILTRFAARGSTKGMDKKGSVPAVSTLSGTGRSRVVTLSGPGVDLAFRARLQDWLDQE
jgi:ParB/RepB/Spo0J family partition protein